jgi:polyketide cyclase/dehydrase/lipid transport protein
MLRKVMMVGLVASLASIVLSSPASAEMKQVPTVRLHAQAMVNAPAGALWARMTRGKNLATWCPMWKSPKNATAVLAKVGDVLDYSDAWGNGGRSVVTYIVRDKEIRVAHEPTNGSYMCQAKLVLTPEGRGTLVHYWEQYTDESGPKDLEATAAKMQSEMDRTLADLKRAVEKR